MNESPDASLAAPTTYPGVYVQEIQSPATAVIVGVTTSVTGFVGRTARGPVGKAMRINSALDFQQAFGGLSPDLMLPWCVRQFFANAGADAVVLRLAGAGAAAAEIVVASAGQEEDGFTLVAASPGAWGNALEARVTIPAAAGGGYGFDLTITDTSDGTEEEFENLSLDPKDGARYIGTVLQTGSALVRYPAPPAVPPAPEDDAEGSGSGGGDGAPLTIADYVGNGVDSGLFALDDAGDVNLVAIPPDVAGGDTAPAVYQAGLTFAAARGAILLVDAPVAWETLVANGNADQASPAVFGFGGGPVSNAAVYFPRLQVVDPTGGPVVAVPPCGSVAGVIARTDATSGVWTAPAGIHAQLEGVSGACVAVDDAEAGALIPSGINTLRTFPAYGTAVWGARTLDDGSGSDLQYLPVRRLFLYIEQSLKQGLEWVAFEPNGPRLWQAVTASVNQFLTPLWNAGGLVGDTPSQAFSVQCDAGTNPPGSESLNVLVTVAPVRPAEFTVLSIEMPVGTT